MGSPVGHTHEDIDQRFSVISRHFAHADARTPDEFVAEVKRAFGSSGLVVHVQWLWFTHGAAAWMEEHQCLDPKLAGFRNYRYWQYEADASSEDGAAVGRARCREHMQEPAGGASQFTEDFTLVVRMPPNEQPPRNPLLEPKITRQDADGGQETVSGTVDG